MFIYMKLKEIESLNMALIEFIFKIALMKIIINRFLKGCGKFFPLQEVVHFSFYEMIFQLRK